MARDYAKKSNRKKTTRKTGKKRKQASSQGKLILITVAVTLLFVAGLFYLRQVDVGSQVKHLVAKHSYTKEKTKVKPVASKHVEKPRFEFYTLLPNDKGIDTKNTKKFVPTQYALQLASYVRYQDADHAKASLTLVGYNPIIEKISVNDKVWYRVSVGPYDSLSKAEIAKRQLQRQFSQTMIRRIT